MGDTAYCFCSNEPGSLDGQVGGSIWEAGVDSHGLDASDQVWDAGGVGGMGQCDCPLLASSCPLC